MKRECRRQTGAYLGTASGARTVLSAASTERQRALSRFQALLPIERCCGQECPRARQGVALVVTLLLLSIITFMTVTFLVVSRSNYGSVVNETEQAVARLGADTAFERAKADLLAAIMASTNEFNYGLLASTNYINPAGFQVAGSPSGLPYNSPANVSYTYPNGSPLTGNDALQNIANLLYNPRPPVYVITNRQFPNSNDFRFYIDLNRNGHFDPNGLQPEIARDSSGAAGFYSAANGAFIPYQWPPPPGIVSNFFVGDLEWIGSLERPEFQHSPDNKFVNRYAYLVVPAGNTLDINYIHNQAGNPKKAKLNSYGMDFLRDQGVGTWEINLAALLCDLNTNEWLLTGTLPRTPVYNDGFTLYPWPPHFNLAPQGNAFTDAGGLLAYRYNKNNRIPAPFDNVLQQGHYAFINDGIDGYTASAYPLVAGSSGFATDPDTAYTPYPWSGGDNLNHFYTTQDLFDETKTDPFNLKPSFTQRLLDAGAATNSYDRYTFYRLLSQLGTDSAAEPAGKLNLNYCNVDLNGNVVPGMATNFIPWIPEQFFTNAAVRLLANAGYTAGLGPTNVLFVNNRGITNLQIQIWPTNFYTPSVHRLLQLAANIYDASTNRTFNVPGATNGFPSVFRPIFGKSLPSGAIFITGYLEGTDANALLNLPMLDLTLAKDRGLVRQSTSAMVWGIPLVIGAKKGLPNFNKFSSQTQVQVTRKLQFHRPGNSNTADVDELDQMFVVGVTNTFGLQAWNSYGTTFPRNLHMVVIPQLNVTLTNRDTGHVLNQTTANYIPPVVGTNIPANTWQYYNRGMESSSFIVPLGSGPGVPYTSWAFVSNATYQVASDTFVPLTGIFQRTPDTTNIYIPHWQLNIRTRLRFALVDTSVSAPGANNGRIVDYVNLDATEDPLDITGALMQDTPGTYSYPTNSTSYTQQPSNGSMWATNRVGGSALISTPTFGIMNQINASLGNLTGVEWNASQNEFPAGMTIGPAQDFFKGQFTPGYLRQSNTFAAPYQPFRNIYKVVDWEANDPLVHYTIGDLKNLMSTNGFLLDNPNPETQPTTSLLKISQRYEPWGGNPKLGAVNAPAYDLRVKDPVAKANGRSDHWSFPTNKYPNIGWLGRVHRGTPWQTVYLKSPTLDLPSWQQWTGNGQLVPYVGQFPTNRLPLILYAGTTNGFFTYDAFLTMPTNDWRMLDLFTTAINDNASRGQLSINQNGLAAWSAVLSGVVVLTNTPWVDGAGNAYVDANGNYMPAPLTIQPAGYYNAFASTNTWPALAQIVNAINNTRANTNVTLNGVFHSLGDILAVPQLTVASPYVYTNLVGANSVLTDAAVERIPQQVLGLLKCDHTPRFVVYSFGQALKPADRSRVTGGPFSRLCTNYQIMAEAATRAVVRVDGAPTNSHIVVESFNVLGPD